MCKIFKVSLKRLAVSMLLTGALFSSMYGQGISLSPSMLVSQWNRTNIKVPFSATIDAQQYKTLIIMEVVDERGYKNDETTDVYEKLSNYASEISGVDLLDRSKTEALLSEIEFQRGGMVSSEQISKIGEFYSSSLLFFIRISRNEYKEDVIYSKSYSDDCSQYRQRVGTYNLDLNIKAIDIQTSKVLLSTNVPSAYHRATRASCDSPEKFNKEDFYQACLNKSSQEFQYLLIDHEREFEVTFKKNLKHNKALKAAIKYFEIDDAEEAYRRLKAIPPTIKKDNNKSDALLNLAILDFYTMNFDESLKNAKEAYMLNSKNDASLILIRGLKDPETRNIRALHQELQEEMKSFLE